MKNNSSSRRQIKAQKEHTCKLCGEFIRMGSQYIQHSAKRCGRIVSFKLHIHCDAIMEAHRKATAGDWMPDCQKISAWVFEQSCRKCIHCELDRGCHRLMFFCPRAVKGVVNPALHEAVSASIRENRMRDAE